MANVETVEIPLDEIDADNSFNCRLSLTTMDTIELAKNIKKLGLIQPVTVKRKKDGKYLLIAGYRRFKAYNILKEEDPTKYSKIRASLVDVSDEDAFRMNLSENVSRKELNIKEEAWACQRLLDFGITPDNVAKELGMSRGWLQCRQWLLELPNEIQDNCVIYSFTQSQIRELANAPNDEIRFQMSQKVIDARTKGIKITKIAKRVRPANKKLKPTYDEVLEMMDKVSKIIGYGIVTRGMAWCNGDLTDREFEADCAAAKGKVL